MTAGNSNFEGSNTHWTDLPQVTEYCLLRLKEKKFIFINLDWLHNWYHCEGDDPEENKVFAMLRSYWTLPDFIHQCLENETTDFIYEKTSADMEVNALSAKQEEHLRNFATGLYEAIHKRLIQSLDFDDRLIPNTENNNAYNLVGFFGTSAIIGLGENVDYVRYPSFKDAYGDLRVKEWRDKICGNDVFQTIIPIIDGECEPFATF